MGPACGGGRGAICCTIKTGGSITEYRIRVRKERCAAYVSFPNLDESAPMSEWPEPGVEIEWELPEEPVCVAACRCRRGEVEEGGVCATLAFSGIL